MKLVLARIDDRLLHAQVALGWVGALSPDVVVVADDKLAEEKHVIPLLRMSLPSEVDMIVVSVDDAVKTLRERRDDTSKCILVVRTPSEALRLVDAGVHLQELNVGGMHFSEGKQRLLDYVYVDGADVETLGRLSSKGIRLIAQDVPGNPSRDLTRLLERVR